MARTASGSSARAPSPYTVSVGNATRPPRRSSAAASSRSAGDRALRSRVSTSRHAFEGGVVDAFAHDLGDRGAPGFFEIGDLRLQNALDEERAPADLADVLERRARRLADRFVLLPVGGGIGEDEAGGILAEQQTVRPESRLERHAAAEVLAEAHLGEGDGQPTVG